MNFCTKCNREIEPGEASFRGMCYDCSIDYFYEKAEHINDPNYENLYPPEDPKTPILDFFKKIFKKKGKK